MDKKRIKDRARDLCLLNIDLNKSMKTIKEKLNIGAGIIVLVLLIWFFISGLVKLPSLDFSSPEITGYIFGNILNLALIIWCGKKLNSYIKK